MTSFRAMLLEIIVFQEHETDHFKQGQSNGAKFNLFFPSDDLEKYFER